jgi:hypothetical protein
VLVKIVDFGGDKLFNFIDVDFKMLELSNIDHAQLLILHHLNQRPKGFLSRFYVVKQDSSDHIETLNIAKLNVINAVAY